MIFLTNGNMPLNAAYADEIVQEENSTYQLSFRFPTSDPLWEKLKEETFLTADDLHGEQDFVIFEVEKKHGYIQVYANQVFTLLNNYVVNPISLDRQTGSTALSRFAGAITRDNPFSFFSDIEDRHTFNIGSKNAMEAFAKDKHSIIGQWGGDLVRHGYQVRLLKNGGSENESLFMYKKNLSSYQHKTSTKSLKTRITFIATVKGEGEKAPDRTFTVTIDSPLINKYSQIYEDVIEVNDQDVKDEASLRKYGEQYYRTSLCDMMEDSLELDVVGQSDVPVQMFDIVSLFHDVYNLDVRKKITKYTYSPMAKKLKSIGFGQFQSGLANAIGNAVSDAVKGEAQQLQGIFEWQLARELKNADLAFDRRKEELVKQFTDDVNAINAKAEETKQEIFDSIGGTFENFRENLTNSVQALTDKALEKAGASSLLAQEAKRIGLDSVARLEEFKRQATSAQTALSGDLDVLKRTIANDIRPKQAQSEAEIAKQVEALVQTKKELSGIKSAQATYEETTTRRLSELTNLANGKASKSELTQTAEELASKIASVQAGSSRNYFRNSRSRTFTTGNQAIYDYRTFIVPDFWKNNDRFKRDYVRLSFDVTFPVALASDTQANVHFSAHPWYGFKLTFKGGTTERQHFEFTIDLSSSSEIYQTNNVFIRFGTNYGFPAGLQVVIENAMLSVGNYFPAYQPAYEDQEDRVSVVESNFRQRADLLDAGVSRLTEGLRTKADISSLNVTAENIRQSVKSLETNMQNKLDQKLSQAEFEVRAGSIRQEILNATKDKADKTLVTAEAGKLREELSTVQDYINKDGQRKEELQRYSREESARQVNAVRELVARDYVGKSTYQEDVRGLERRFSAISTQTNNDIATKIAQYKQTVDGQFANITSQIAGKANQTDFQRVKETSQLYERILGNTENGIADKVARMAVTNQIFQVEVGKYNGGGPNLVKNGDFKDGIGTWNSSQNVAKLVKHEFYLNGQKDLICLPNSTQKELFLFSPRFELERNTDYVLNFRAFNNNSLTNCEVFVLGRRKDENTSFTIAKLVLGKTKFSTAKCEDVSVTFNSGEMDNAYIRFDNNGSSSETADLYITEVDLYKGYKPRPWQPAPEDVVTDANAKLEAIRTQMTLLQGSWAVQNLTSAGSIVSQINATNNQILIEAEKIRLKGKTLLDELTAIQGYFKRLFVGEGTFATLNADVIRTNSITADKLVMDMAMARRFVSSDLFTDTLAAKEAFINKLRSVVVTATLLEGYRGRIGGFQIGTHDNDPSSFWLTGLDQFKVGMSNGRGREFQTAFWANWGNTWGRPGPLSWYVTLDGKMYCNNDATFHRVVDFSSTCSVNFYGANSFYKDIYMRNGSEIYGTGSTPRAGGKNSVVWWNQVGDGSLKYHIDMASDKRLKENIVDSNIVALDKIKQLKMKSFDFISSGKHEEVGLIAQEVEAILPSVISKNPEKADDYLHIDYVAIVPYLIKSIQELNQKIEEMEKTVA